MRFIALALAMEAGIVTVAAATIIHVPSAQPTIQAGIDAASAGDTVLVAPGTYAGLGNRDLSFGGTDLVVRSSGGSGETIIDCQAQGRGFHFRVGETSASVVEGFTIRNGLAGGAYGGGILIEGGATPTIRGCRFVTNHANTGGGIFVTSGVTLSDCQFEGNTADNYGGGIYGRATLGMARCSFAENSAPFGAGIYVNDGATVAATDCSFTGNAALNLAGGVYGSTSALTFQRCSFVGNTATIGAGAHLLEGTASADSCTFRMNMAEYCGGGIYAANVDVFTLTGCGFEGNASLSDAPSGLPSGGGGVSHGSPDPPRIPPHVADCTFTANRSLGENEATGGGLSGSGLIERCTFTSNHADAAGGGARSGGRLHECVFEGNTAKEGGGLAGGYELIDCRFIDNHAETSGGGAFNTDAVVRCEFSGNSAGGRGGGFAYISFPAYTIEGCRFSDNHAPDGGGIYVYSREPSSIAGCTFDRNTGSHEGGAAIILGHAESPAPATFSGCTLVGNGSPLGAGGLNLGIPVEIENTIIAFGTEGEAITCGGTGLGVVSCTDIFGNAGGDWTGCISDQVGINGNFSADPLFCNVGGGDYTLAETSPCAPEHSPAGCGLIGAFPVACVNPIGVAGEAAPPVAGRLRVTPNPMRGGGLIEWVSENAALVSVRLYDPLGRLVTSRTLGLMPEGRQELRWDGLVGDRRLPPGVYLLELGGPSGGVDRARVVLIR